MSHLVKQSCAWVVQQSKHVQINQQKLQEACQQLSTKYVAFEAYECHLNGQSDEAQLQYLFVLDTLNFCFWPQKGFEYDNLAANIKSVAIQAGLHPKQVLTWTNDYLKNNIFGGVDFPLLSERLRLLHETATIALEYDGLYTNIVKEAQGSSQKLLRTLTTKFTGFQDHAIYQGRQIFFYKRSQILIGDIYAAFQGKGLGEFYDIGELTMFPDYRVPQILNHLGVMQYTEELTKVIADETVIEHGSAYEVEIRAATVIAVEQIKDILKLKTIEVDWILWQLGEQQKDTINKHHRTLSIYY